MKVSFYTLGCRLNQAETAIIAKSFQNQGYEITDFGNPGTLDLIKSENYQYLDIPLIIGLKAGPVRLGAGPVGHVFIDSSSELFDIDGYEQKFDEMTWGWQGGIGFDIWNIHLDIKYEGNFSNFSNHFIFYLRECVKV